MMGAAIDVKTGKPLSAEAKDALRAAEHARIEAIRREDVATLAASKIQGLARVRRGGLLISSLNAE